MEEKFATKVELLETKMEIENTLHKKINGVDKKVDTLNQIVLPLVESSKQTAKNTEKMSNVLEEFTKDQRKRNGEFYDRFHEHDLAINNLDVDKVYKIEDKKIRYSLWGVVITAVLGLLGAVFGLAPLLFN